jgi:F-type H+-transporting ATPase subunit b
MKCALSLGLVALCLAWFRAGGRLRADEVPLPGEQPAGEEARIAAAEGVPPEPPINPVKAELGLAVWTVVVFVLLMAVLTKFAWKPLLEALHSREQHLEHVLLETERARNESEAALAEHRRLMAKASDEVRAILDKARQEAEAAANERAKQAQTEAEATKQRALRDIAAARDSALAEIWEKTADMAVTVAGRVLDKQLTETDHRRLLEAAIKELPAAANGRGGKRA